MNYKYYLLVLLNFYTMCCSALKDSDRHVSFGETAELLLFRQPPDRVDEEVLVFDIPLEDPLGRTPLMRAALDFNWMRARKLIKEGADLTAKDNEGLTILTLLKKLPGPETRRLENDIKELLEQQRKIQQYQDIIKRLQKKPTTTLLVKHFQEWCDFHQRVYNELFQKII